MVAYTALYSTPIYFILYLDSTNIVRYYRNYWIKDNFILYLDSTNVNYTLGANLENLFYTLFG